MTKSFYDSAEPLASPPTGFDGVLFYGWGDTPHIWTPEQIEAQPARYRLPTCVRSDPSSQASDDANGFLGYLKSIGCPTNVAVCLDLEEAVDPNYVSIFGNTMRVAGYYVLPYGSSGFLFKNPVLDGYFVAWPGKTAIPENCVGLQYGQAHNESGTWDLDVFADTVVFWDTRPPITDTKGDDPMSIAIALDGTRLIERVSPEGHQLLFSVAAPTTEVPSPVPHVLDVTDAIATANPGIPLYTVEP
jgi:hypothetical protein